MTKWDLNCRQAQRAAELAEYNFMLHFKKGCTMTQADALLRQPDLKGGVELDNKEQILLPSYRFSDLRALSGMVLGTQGDRFVQ